MILKMGNELTIPGITKVNVTVDHEVYVHFWVQACNSIGETLGTALSRPEINKLGHKVMEKVFNRLVTASLISLTPESLGEIVKNEVKVEVKDFIPGITKV